MERVPDSGSEWLHEAGFHQRKLYLVDRFPFAQRSQTTLGPVSDSVSPIPRLKHGAVEQARTEVLALKKHSFNHGKHVSSYFQLQGTRQSAIFQAPKKRGLFLLLLHSAHVCV
jgi:hypothetical protein